MHRDTVDATWAAAVETHTAALFFAGDHVFKVKKPVRLDFIDLTTPEARRDACRAEVSLNRRLAPDVYLGVADITLAGNPVEHAVVMRRLPEDASLAARVAGDDPELARMVADVADALAAFHARCLSVRKELPAELWTPPIALYRKEVERTAQLMVGSSAHPLLTRTLVLAENYAGGRGALFTQRLEAGHVRDGHGDLLAADIYLLPDGPRVLDCLEFDERLRIADVLHDVAFLAMDLEHRGRPDLADAFLTRYAATAGETHPPTLAHFFIAHRALVRAKVAAIRGQQVGGGADSSGADLMTMCVRHLEAAQVRMVVIGGLPATGKTTVAAALADEMPAVHLSSDRIRYELTGGEAETADFGTGRYASATTDEVYAEMLRRAAAAAQLGEHVILDASWRSDHHRRLARQLAKELHLVPVELRLTVDEATARTRLSTRGRTLGGSEATIEVRDEMRRRFDPWPQATCVDGRQPAALLAQLAEAAAEVAVRNVVLQLTPTGVGGGH